MLRPVLLATLALLVLPAAAGAQELVDDNAAVASPSAGKLDVAARAADGTVVVRELDVATGAWSDWTAVRGLVASSGPGLSADDDGTLHLFARTPSNGIAEATRTATGWSAWSTPAPGSTLTGIGTDNRAGTAELDMGIVGLDGVFRHTVRAAPGQPFRQSFGAPLAAATGTTQPTLVSRGAHLLDAFIRAGDGSVTDIRYVPADGWSQSTLGGNLRSALSAITRATNQMDVYGRSPGGAIYGNTFTGSAWSGWTKFANTAGTSAPAATTTGGGRVDMVVRDQTTLYHRFFTGTGPDHGWSNFTAVGPIEAPVDRGAANGSGGGDGATVSIAFKSTPKPAKTFKLGQTITVGGVLRNAAGGPVPGAVLGLSGRQLAAGAPDATVAAVTTGPDGTWSARLKAGPGRQLTIGYVAFANDAQPAAAASLKARTRAKLSLSVSRKTARRGTRVTFRGKLAGGAVPSKGKPVALQAYQRGKWRPFATPRAGRKGRFSARYRFEVRPTRRTRIAFRAVAPTEAGYPFTRGVSAKRVVVLKP